MGDKELEGPWTVEDGLKYKRNIDNRAAEAFCILHDIYVTSTDMLL